jgi:diguanylate cyclase (GGDEF)-like protein
MTTILIVDTRPTDRQTYTTLLGSFGYRVLEASDGSEALETARTELPDLVITEIIMPNMDGFTLTRRLRAEPLLASVPVIFQTVHYLEAEVRKLATASGIQHILTDELTGLNNRRGFMILANSLLKFSRRANHPLCLLYIDMDSLKMINDTFGHTYGDSALTHFAHILTMTFRDSDVIARMGGDEFAVLTIDATEGSLNAIQERLQGNVDTHNLEAARGYALSFSMGIIRVDLNSTFTVDALLAQADQAMYAHKKKKKRKV